MNNYGVMKRKCKQKNEDVIKKLPKISSFFQQPDSISDLDCNVNCSWYLPTPRKSLLFKILFTKGIVAFHAVELVDADYTSLQKSTTSILYKK